MLSKKAEKYDAFFDCQMDYNRKVRRNKLLRGIVAFLDVILSKT